MNVEAPIWVTVINIFLDVFVIITIPLYIVFLKNLVIGKKENIYTSGFVFILFANGFWNIASSVVNILLNEIPQRGIFLDFYTNDPNWKGRISKAFEFGVQFFQLLSLITVTINRWFAVKQPIIYITLFSPNNMKHLYGILYLCTILYMIPILIFPDVTIYIENGVNYFGFVESDTFVLVYGIMYDGIGLIAFIVWLIANLQISCYITKHDKYEHDPSQTKAQKSLAKVTLATFLFTSGTMLHFIIQISNDIPLRIFGVSKVYPILTLFTLIRIGQELTNLSTPWLMLLLSSEMRNGVKIVLGLANEEVSDLEFKAFELHGHKPVRNFAKATVYPSTVAAKPLQIKL